MRKFLWLMAISSWFIILTGCDDDNDLITAPSYTVWLSQNCDTRLTFGAVHFTDAINGWVLGYQINSGKSVILTSNNGGKTWNTRSSHAKIYLADLFFLTPDAGWFSGFDYNQEVSAVFSSNDGGKTVIARPIPGGNWGLSEIYFYDAQNGWVLAENGVIHTKDGGNLWAMPTSQQNLGLWDAHFIDADTVWAVGRGGRVFRSGNGGASWLQQASLNKYEGLKSVFFLNANLGWILGSEILLRTVNGGRDWIASTIENYNGFNFIHFIDEKNGWILGDNGLILKTGTSGVNWKVQDSGTVEALHSGIFLNARTGWAVGDRGTILKMLVIDG